jgi:hypothetical protein
MTKRKTQGLVNFLRKHEGKEPVKIAVSKRIDFPQVDDIGCFESLCEIVYADYLAGTTLIEEDRYLVDFGFTWDTSPIEWTLWKEMYETGYIHPECYECLVAWHKMMEAGELTPQTPF